MATNRRTYQDGINLVDGYEINIIRFVGAYQNGESSRIAAHYWGTITHPNGDVTDMGDSGMTVSQIKKIVGGSKMTYNRGGRGKSEIAQLNALKSQLVSLGMNTDEVDAKIAAIEEEKVQEQRLEEFNRLKKAIEKDVEQLNALKSTLESLGMSTDEVDARIAARYADIEEFA